MAIDSRSDLASRHGNIVRIAVAHSCSYRSANPICTRTPNLGNEDQERQIIGSSAIGGCRRAPDGYRSHYHILHSYCSEADQAQ